MSGTLKVDGSGNVELKEQDGIDYAATTVQLPGGERVPFLFTVKELEAKGTLDAFGGDFKVPSYRGATFLDPKVSMALTVSVLGVGLSGWDGQDKVQMAVLNGTVALPKLLDATVGFPVATAASCQRLQGTEWCAVLLPLSLLSFSTLGRTIPHSYCIMRRCRMYREVSAWYMVLAFGGPRDGLLL